MAEGLVNGLRGDHWHAFSAGTRPIGHVHPEAVAALKEIGLDISGARSKPVDQFKGQDFDVVITVCEDAAEECPVWLGPGKRHHICFPDPSKGTAVDFRKVRDDMQKQILSFLDRYEKDGS